MLRGDHSEFSVPDGQTTEGPYGLLLKPRPTVMQRARGRRRTRSLVGRSVALPADPCLPLALAPADARHVFLASVTE
jgi:hypothetical protein